MRKPITLALILLFVLSVVAHAQWASDATRGRPLVYDFKSFTLSTGQVDYDVDANVSDLFNNVPVAQSITIFTTQNITFKLNSSSMPSVTLDTVYQPFESPDNFIEITNIFLTNLSGTDSTVKIWLY